MNKIVENMIYGVMGRQVMLDLNLAGLYGCANGTKTINQAVKRHISKFPERYVFKLTDEEYKKLKSQVGTINSNNYGGNRKLPNVFTEQGVAMFATILRTKVADIISMKIIDVFVYMRKYMSYESKNTILINHEERILKLEESFERMSSKQNSIIYEGKIYDAYSILIDILNEATREVIIIDNYTNKELLDILRNVDKKIIIFSKNIDDVLVKKYSSQYNNIIFICNNTFHDRYIILDRKDVYISGMSLKDVGKKYGYIYKMNEELFKKELLKRIENMLQ